MLEIDRLSKSFGSLVALRDCSLTAAEGRLLGLLGPNGAGKTTLMRAVLGLVRPDGGSIRWRGRELRQADRFEFGYMPEERGLYPSMRVGEQVEHFAALGGLSTQAARAATATVLARVGLGGLEGRKVLQLSHGNQQRAQLAVALVNDPALLVLDEPFAGLDPLGVDVLGQLLRDLAAEGRTVVFSSHQLDLVQDLCQDVVIVHAGSVVLAGVLEELRAASPHRSVEVSLAGPGSGTPPWWDALPLARAASVHAGRVSLLLDRHVDPAEVLARARTVGEVAYFAFTPPSLEDLFRSAVQPDGRAA